MNKNMKQNSLKEVALVVGGTYVKAKVSANIPPISAEDIAKLRSVGFKFVPEKNIHTRFAVLGSTDSDVYALAMYDGGTDFSIIAYVLDIPFRVYLSKSIKARHNQLTKLAEAVKTTSSGVSKLIKLEG